MCLAILKLADSHLTKRKMRNGYQLNPDGAGFMFAADNQLHISKGYFAFRKFYKAYRQAEHDYPKSDFVIHFRIATSGKTDEATCHPFYVHQNLAFMHNGIFSKLGNKMLSDTQQYNRQILKTYPKDFIYNQKFVNKISKFCGYFNKLIFLDNKGVHLIIGELNGIWENNIWFSNDTYKDIVDDNTFGFSTIQRIYDIAEYENENIDWNNCYVCGGFYPIHELYKMDKNEYLCEHCDSQINSEYYQKVKW